MGLHKLTAGDGYTYLTRQVAVQDATERGHSSLGDYYAERGESPGRWWGSGLAGLGLEAGAAVAEEQMRNLFGAGRHPDAERLVAHAEAAGQSAHLAARAGRLGRPFPVFAGPGHPLPAEVARRLVEYNCRHGRPGAASVPTEVRARIRTSVADELFRDEHGRAPLDDRERAGFLARASRQRTTAVAGYDLTFTPVKSVSVLWAVAPPEVAAAVEAAHDAAVARTLAYLEREVLFTRRGRQGVQQVRTRGLVTAQFRHRDARSGEPNLHTHVAVSNKVQAYDSGDWLAVDGRPLHKAAVTLSETYNTLLEAELGRRLGLRFHARPAPAGKREIREVLGVDPALVGGWSSRAVAIEGRRRVLAAGFQQRFGRPPTAVEAIALSQQATLETRQAKHAPRGEEEQRRAWRAEAEAVLGSPAAVRRMVSRVVRPVVRPGQGRDPRRARPTESWVAGTARRLVEIVSDERATWQIWHLRAEAHRQVRAANLPWDVVDATVDRLVQLAVETHCVTIDDPDPLLAPGRTPAPLRRADGQSVYRQHGGRAYTTAAVVRAEQDLLAVARAGGGRRAADLQVSAAIGAATEGGVPLDSAQRSLVRTLLTSGARLQLALAPAGTGKTTALGVLADAWRRSGGSVLGLAPSAVAAQQLGEALGEPTETLSKLAWSLHHDTATPAWVSAIGPGTLLVVDEAGMASTRELADVVRHVVSRGGSVRLVGDDRQLAAVAAGGVLRDLLHHAGAATLTEVHRFSDNTEAAATLAVRSGDASALGFYLDHGRIHTGDASTAADQAFRAWLDDCGTGRQSILLAATREAVADLNARARAHRLSSRPGEADSTGHAEVPLPDGSRASAGDAVITRRNLRSVRLSDTDWVKNGDRWTLQRVNPDGSLTIRHDRLARSVQLPADYVRAGHLQLGYATTIHGAQGVTVDTAHAVLTGAEDRRQLYVALTRGRDANHLYVATSGTGDPHEAIRPEALRPLSTADQVLQIIARDGATESATTTLRHRLDPALLIHEAAARYHDAVTSAAEHLLPVATAQQLDDLADRPAALPGRHLGDEPAWPTLRSHLALQAHRGHDPVTLLDHATALGPLSDAVDAAAVLDARITTLVPTPAGPLPWLPSVPPAIVDDPEWGDYVTGRAQRVTTLATDLAELAGSWQAADAPTWARDLLADEHAPLRADLAVWRAVHGVPDEHPRPTGTRQIGAPGQHQGQLDRRLRAALRHDQYQQRPWFAELPRAVVDDPWSTVLGQRLARLERSGADVADLTRRALRLDRPLPDSQPAASLWWRIAGQVAPAALDQARLGSPLRPDWTADLEATLAARQLTEPADAWMAAPAWPALVAAIDDARHRHGWDPAQTLASALMHPPSGTSSAERCESLLLAVSRLADATVDTDRAAGATGDSALPGPDDRRAIEPSTAPSTSPRLPSPVPSSPPPPTSRPPLLTAERPADPTRLLALNEVALAFYRDLYPRSWAPGYLHDRLPRTLLPADHDWRGLGLPEAGYAPPGPQGLIRHLAAHGASPAELAEAGLVRERERRGRSEWVDQFRDRLVWPIRDRDGNVVGFIGRRNPTKDDHAGPKYLNTPTTPVFTKGHHVFGLAEGRPLLDSGARPVLVEGPLDALAVTLCSEATAVGLAPLGTAVTRHQADLLAWASAVSQRPLVVAADADAAGRSAAERAYWELSLADLRPEHLHLPAGSDPASLAAHDPGALRAALGSTRPLDQILIERLLADAPVPDATALHGLTADVARVLGAQPTSHWRPEVDRLAVALGVSAHEMSHAVLHQSMRQDRLRAERILGR